MEKFNEYMANLELADAAKNGTMHMGSTFHAKGKHSHRVKRKVSFIDWILSFLP